MPLRDEWLNGRYQIKRQLGFGGMGAVYEAEDRQRFGKLVALKEIRIDFTKDTTAKQKELVKHAFEREAKILTQLEHEAFPQVVDYFVEGDRQFLVMELVQGDDLDRQLSDRQEPFKLEEVLNLAEQLLDALDYLHTLNPPIIHRDIKPQNLKLTSRGRIKLLDFGIAKGSDTQANFTITNQTFLAATLHYSPFEQILRVIDPSLREALMPTFGDKIKKVFSQSADATSDIYSLGATLYHLATNTLPVDAMKRALKSWAEKGVDPLVPPQRIDPQIPSDISDWLMKAMEIESENRFGGAAEMHAALRELIRRRKQREEAEEREKWLREQEWLKNQERLREQEWLRKQEELKQQEWLREQEKLQREREQIEAERKKIEASWLLHLKQVEEAKRQAALEQQRLQEAAERLAEQKLREEERRRLETEQRAREEEAERRRRLEAEDRHRHEEERKRREDDERRRAEEQRLLAAQRKKLEDDQQRLEEEKRRAEIIREQQSYATHRVINQPRQPDSPPPPPPPSSSSSAAIPPPQENVNAEAALSLAPTFYPGNPANSPNDGSAAAVAADLTAPGLLRSHNFSAPRSETPVNLAPHVVAGVAAAAAAVPTSSATGNDRIFSAEYAQPKKKLLFILPAVILVFLSAVGLGMWKLIGSDGETAGSHNSSDANAQSASRQQQSANSVAAAETDSSKAGQNLSGKTDYLQIAEDCSRNKNYGCAVENYTNALKLNAKDPGAYHNRGLAYFNQNDFNNAIADYTRAIELNPDNAAGVYRDRALAYEKIGENALASNDRQAAGKLEGGAATSGGGNEIKTGKPQPQPPPAQPRKTVPSQEPAPKRTETTKTPPPPNKKPDPDCIFRGDCK